MLSLGVFRQPYDILKYYIFGAIDSSQAFLPSHSAL